ncbi:transposase domain-containing protein [Streptomyces sp. NPDC127051]|uniref:transposase domain-containing protein n=1 Tax=Streptomyces sp. NPDC127051 TaxID=3347119 RepID=UPI00365E4D64
MAFSSRPEQHCPDVPSVCHEVLAECRKRDRRPGALSAGFMVYFTALALFQQDSHDDVAEHVVGAIPELSGCIPHKASFTRARERLGPEPLERLFHRLAGPLAPPGLAGSFYRAMRIAAVDGFLLDAPDSNANRRAFGGPNDSSGKPGGFPQVRVVTLTATGTHGSIEARVGGYNSGEREPAVAMASSAAGMLVLMDRGSPGVELWKAYTGAGAHLLLRARSCVARRPVWYLPEGTNLARMNLAGQKGAHPGSVLVRVIEYRVDGGEAIRLLTGLFGHDAYPAKELAALYLDTLRLHRHEWHGDWNYTLRPEAYALASDAPDPFDQPSPDLAWLCHPALTGMPVPEREALITTLTALHESQRETALDKRRGHRPRVKGDGTTGRRPILTLADQLLATLLHQRLGLPQAAIASLFAVTPFAINRRIRDIRQLLKDVTTPPPKGQGHEVKG